MATFKKRLLVTEEEQEKLEREKNESFKKVKLRNTLYSDAEAFLNHHYKIAEWTCMDEESDKAMNKCAICTSQAPVGVRLYSETSPPYQFTIQALLVKDKEDSTITLCPVPPEAKEKTRIIDADARLGPVENHHNPKIDGILRKYMIQLLSVVDEHNYPLLEPKMEYSSFNSNGETHVRYELKSKVSSQNITIPVPWPGADAHQLRLEEMRMESMCQCFVFSFHVKDS
jgi:hypothetical protein